MKRPIFIVGCGRSGTTILGKTLSQHAHITYLNEARHHWANAYPQTDIWSRQAQQRKGQLVLTEADVQAGRCRLLHWLFRQETLRTGRPILLEKLPINSFRLPFIYKIFPDARFIHLVRNGIEVARSIARLAEEGRWFGADDYKWKQLCAYAEQCSEVASIIQEELTPFERGLIEWRLSIEAARTFFRQHPQVPSIEIEYGHFVDQPREVVNEILKFVDLIPDEAVYAFAYNNIARRSPSVKDAEYTERARSIGGRALEEW